MMELKKERKIKNITIALKVILIINLILIILNYIKRTDEYSFPFISKYSQIYIWICLAINLFLLFYKSKNEKILKLILIFVFFIIMFITPTYREFEKHNSGMIGSLVEVHTNILGMRIWSDY